MSTIGVIGGSGMYEIEGLSEINSLSVDTPWGKPSDKIVKGKIEDFDMYFLPRHGKGHKLLPSEINYRANIYAMKELRVDYLVSVSAVGSMKEKIAPGHVVIPSQFIDFTKKRESTFFGDGVAAHVSMADPVCPILSQSLFEGALISGATVHMGGTYICIEGPQFSTRAESDLYRGWDVDVIGMTNMPEAKLAREVGICYSTLALSTDYDCWHIEHEEVTVDDVIEILNQNIELARQIIKNLLSNIPPERSCSCKNALENAIITDEDSMTKKEREKIKLFFNGDK